LEGGNKKKTNDQPKKQKQQKHRPKKQTNNQPDGSFKHTPNRYGKERTIEGKGRLPRERRQNGKDGGVRRLARHAGEIASRF